MMVPTARHARGDPAADAMSPYVATRPGGIRRTAESTRFRKSETLRAITSHRPANHRQHTVSAR